jgi:geranylgeranyl diphosphate synthase type II
MLLATKQDIRALLEENAEDVNGRLQRLLARYKGPCPCLAEAVRYSLLAGGKRLRPALVLWSCELCGGSRDAAMPAALAVECVHTFSLIHDDLPAIDDSDLRRGQPSNHKVFGEGLALLAGDALLALAFETLTQEGAEPAVTLAMIKELAAAVGWTGMIGGEAADVEGESAPPNLVLVRRIHAAKTARLIQACCRLGAMAAEAPVRETSLLEEYGHHLGLAFQAADDLLDLTGSVQALGKSTSEDAAASKQTYPRTVGIEDAHAMARAEAQQAAAILSSFGPQAARLISVAWYAVERQC